MAKEPRARMARATRAARAVAPTFQTKELERVLVVASGKNVPIEGFDRRSLDAKLAIAVTANFVNSHTAEEAEVRQISGVAKQFHQVRQIKYTYLCKCNYLESYYRST